LTAPSLRQLWVIYRKILADAGMGRRDLILAQGAFYAGTRSVFEVLAYLRERGDDDEVLRIVERHGRQIGAAGTAAASAAALNNAFART
jgi:hypothetical protein